MSEGSGKGGRCIVDGACLNPFCASLPDSVRKQLCDCARIWRVSQGHCASARDIATSIVIVQQGLLVVCAATRGDKSAGLMMCDPGHLLNIVRLGEGEPGLDMPCWNDGHWGYTALDAVGCQVPLDVFNRLLADEPAFARSMVGQLIAQYRSLTEYGVGMQDLSSEARVGWFLDQLARRGVGPSDITHEMIGRLLRMNRVTVTRAMAAILQKSSCK